MYESPRAQLLIQRAVRAGGRLGGSHRRTSAATSVAARRDPIRSCCWPSGSTSDHPACQVCACPADERSQRTLRRRAGV